MDNFSRIHSNESNRRDALPFARRSSERRWKVKPEAELKFRRQSEREVWETRRTPAGFLMARFWDFIRQRIPRSHFKPRTAARGKSFRRLRATEISRDPRGKLVLGKLIKIRSRGDLRS